MSNIKVVLNKEIPSLGNKGDIVKVKAGYARNYLLVKKYAVLLTSPESKDLITENVNKKRKTIEKQSEKKSQIENLEGRKIQFFVKVNKKNIPFKAIKAKDIAKELKILESMLKVEPLKTLGEHVVNIKADKNNLKVIVEILPEK